eukprot:gene2577-3192_t
MSNLAIQAALELVQKAVTLDQNGKIQEAISMYSLALDHLYQLMDTSTGQTKETFKSKIDEYTKRVDYLKSTLFMNQNNNVHQQQQQQPKLSSFPSPPPLQQQSADLNSLSKDELIGHALKFATQAVNSESENKIQEAVLYYRKCSEYLEKASQMTDDIETRLTLNQKQNEYSSRADFLTTTKLGGIENVNSVNNSSNNGSSFSSSNLPFPQVEEPEYSSVYNTPAFNQIELSNNASEYIDMAINYTQEAIKMDDIHNYSKAIHFYDLSIQYFEAALQCENNFTVRQLIGEKLTNAKCRTNFLKVKLGQSVQEVNVIPLSSKPGQKYIDPVRKKTVLERLAKTIRGPKNISDHWL